MSTGGYLPNLIWSRQLVRYRHSAGALCQVPYTFTQFFSPPYTKACPDYNTLSFAPTLTPTSGLRNFQAVTLTIFLIPATASVLLCFHSLDPSAYSLPVSAPPALACIIAHIIAHITHPNLTSPPPHPALPPLPQVEPPPNTLDLLDLQYSRCLPIWSTAKQLSPRGNLRSK